ncbi:MAG: deoxynucleoside kinase [Candidatus Alcyoniella australis]|nr:deoxynucleoside kinase [Candidatus Alcyoniella australis]
MARGRHIVIEGPIGVGKTSMTRMLAQRIGARPLFEQASENPFLEDFYRDRRKFAFQTQIFFLLSRWQQQKELAQPDLFSEGVVADYLFAKDRIFAQLNLSERELTLYNRLYDLLITDIPKPDLVVYLAAPTKVLLKRIRQRGTPQERPITSDYLEELNQTYNRFFFNYEESPLLVVNTSEIDFVANTDDFEELLREILSHERGVKHFIPLGSG